MDSSIYAIIEHGGTVALLLFFLFGFYRRWWVMGWTYEAKAKEADEWKHRALRGARVAEKAIDTAEDLASKEPKS